ncbi:hypothetical protein [Crocosphaera sp. Alani8]|uniref:hypothetical protein n=1 Tax=Crocosphaera sp. Alani8 TaxID=3038952 RepID=UPI00313CF902
MQSTTGNPISSLLAFFKPHPTTVTLTKTETESQAELLSKMIQQQKPINDLIRVYEKDERGQLVSKWVKGC